MNTPVVIDVVAAIIERDGKILLARRAGDRDQAGLWEFPGGKVESGESQPAALARELAEELGIEATIDEFVASHQHPISGRIIALHAWTVSQFHGIPEPRCHSEFAWCAPEQAFNYALAPADIPLLEAFMASRASR